jgi:adenylate cyclase
MDNNQKLLERAIELYCGKTVLNRIHELGERALEPGFQESEFTMLGQDIKDFTDITKPVSMDDLVHLQSEYLDLMSENLINHGAKIDHYNGDFILAYWSTKSDTHAIDACNAGIKAIEIGEKLSEKWTTFGFSKLQLKIAINTGSVFIGNFGSSYRLNYMLIGDHLNYLYRLVGVNDRLNTNILISDFTRALLKDEFNFQKVQEVQIKGQKGIHKIYTIKTNSK